LRPDAQPTEEGTEEKPKEEGAEKKEEPVVDAKK